MVAEWILALYDQDRREVEIFGLQREATSRLVRHIFADGSGLVTYSDLDSSNADQVIGEQVAHFGHQGRDLTWIVCEHDTPTDLKERLLEHGFEAEEPEAVLVLDLGRAPSLLLQAVQQDVRRIEHSDHLDDVITIHRSVWGGSQSDWRARLAERLLEAPHTLGLYVAYVDGTPASTAQVSFYAHGRFASLVRAATLPAYRARGLFSSLVATVAQEARRRGVQFLDTEANAMSRPVLVKLGFQLLTWAHPCIWRANGGPPPMTEHNGTMNHEEDEHGQITFGAEKGPGQAGSL
jgi:GNAT superfamily N-acetyltransferase